MIRYSTVLNCSWFNFICWTGLHIQAALLVLVRALKDLIIDGPGSTWTRPGQIKKSLLKPVDQA